MDLRPWGDPSFEHRLVRFYPGYLPIAGGTPATAAVSTSHVSGHYAAMGNRPLNP